MPARDLLQNPVWRGEELGRPIPASPHAVSVALPRWQDVVGYEEKTPEVVNALTSGYPRFFIHAAVRELARQIGDGRPCLPFPSLRAARLCAEFIERSSGQRAKVLAFRGVHGVVTNDSGAPALRAFWQHTGLIVSTREAEAHLGERVPEPDDSARPPVPAPATRRLLRLRGGRCVSGPDRHGRAVRRPPGRHGSGRPANPRPNWGFRMWTP